MALIQASKTLWERQIKSKDDTNVMENLCQWCCYTWRQPHDGRQQWDHKSTHRSGFAGPLVTLKEDRRLAVPEAIHLPWTWWMAWPRWTAACTPMSFDGGMRTSCFQGAQHSKWPLVGTGDGAAHWRRGDCRAWICYKPAWPSSHSVMEIGGWGQVSLRNR